MWPRHGEQSGAIPDSARRIASTPMTTDLLKCHLITKFHPLQKRGMPLDPGDETLLEQTLGADSSRHALLLEVGMQISFGTTVAALSAYWGGGTSIEPLGNVNINAGFSVQAPFLSGGLDGS